MKCLSIMEVSRCFFMLYYWLQRWWEAMSSLEKMAIVWYSYHRSRTCRSLLHPLVSAKPQEKVINGLKGFELFLPNCSYQTERALSIASNGSKITKLKLTSIV